MKQSVNRSRQYYVLATMVMIFTSVLSCKKTEVVPYERTSNNTILEYKVTNAADTLFGAIDNIRNTITLYIPYYVGIDYVVPEIVIDKDAKLLDAAGNVINLDGGIAPVPLDTTGYTYTVSGSDSTKRKYTLVLRIAPHPDSLKVGYVFTQPGSTEIDYDSSIRRAVYGRLPIYGNLGSTSANAKFTLTNRTTGQVYTDILKTYEVTPGANYYTMMLDISADADSGYYNVKMEHQGRTAQLPPIRLVYNKPKFTNLKSTSVYAPGDTVTFAVQGRNTNDTQNGSLIGLDRVYMKFVKSGFNFGGSYPATFPDDLFGQQLGMKIISSSRTEVKAVFPELPAGAIGSYIYSFTIDYPGIGFYFDFKDETGWGKDNMLATIGRIFTITAKK
ncbi:hypothetical protein [Chitinophaga sp. S165]|uniref:hypothetical protein n=1 Tax=Chitinophaga sp. S165 TaxID=2135462 RepID=UPI0011B3B209|nr:hypothetical protein [Chitinophaga sp. S165]